jgi:hypothetical protein
MAILDGGLVQPFRAPSFSSSKGDRPSNATRPQPGETFGHRGARALPSCLCSEKGDAETAIEELDRSTTPGIRQAWEFDVTRLVPTLSRENEASKALTPADIQVYRKSVEFGTEKAAEPEVKPGPGC